MCNMFEFYFISFNFIVVRIDSVWINLICKNIIYKCSSVLFKKFVSKTVKDLHQTLFQQTVTEILFFQVLLLFSFLY